MKGAFYSDSTKMSALSGQDVDTMNDYHATRSRLVSKSRDKSARSLLSRLTTNLPAKAVNPWLIPEVSLFKDES